MNSADKTKVFSRIKVLNTACDAALLFGQLTLNGQTKDTVLFESADHETHESDKSIIMSKAAVKAACRGQNVVLESLSKNGLLALDVLAKELVEFVVSSELGKVCLSFNKNSTEINLEKRLLAKSPLDVLRAMTKLFVLENIADADKFMIIGGFAYDVIDLFEELPAAKLDELNCPDYIFWLPEQLIVMHHRKQTTQLIEYNFGAGFSGDESFQAIENICTSLPAAENNLVKYGNLDLEFISNISDADYQKIVEDLKKYIVSGDVYQIVPSRAFKIKCSSAFAVYKQLRLLNPSPYMYYLKSDNFVLLGASPETFIKVTSQNRKVEIHPIAGTRRRGFTDEGAIDLDLDARIELDLKQDEKELAEHLMLVDLARNDIARVAKTNTRRVSKLLTVDRYLHVMHLVSRVEGELRDNLDALHAYRASANMGTLVGAPKIRAATILREVELTKRGFYGGAVGYFDQNGNFDTAIVIRSAVVKDGFGYVQAGAGVVYDSVSKSEVEETKNKAASVLLAFALANEQEKMS